MQNIRIYEKIISITRSGHEAIVKTKGSIKARDHCYRSSLMIQNRYILNLLCIATEEAVEDTELIPAFSISLHQKAHNLVIFAEKI